MRTTPTLALLIASALVAAPALAQQNSTSPPASAPSQVTSDSQASAVQTPPGQPTPPQTTTQAPLTIATVKLDSGWRASKLLGASVTNEQGQAVGTVDDMILDSDNKVSMVIVSVGGFLGIGSKLVAVPYQQLRVGPNMKVVMPGATKEALNTMPSFTYGT